MAEGMQNEAKVVAAVAPNLVQTPQRKTGGFIEAHRCPDCDVGDGIAFAIGLAENMGVLVTW